MDFRDNKAIYIQIADYLYEKILAGEFLANEKINSIRDLAISLEVNPNTVQRTFDLLQQQEIIINKRGIGFFLSENAKDLVLEIKKREFSEIEMPLFLKNAKMLGITELEILTAYNEYVYK